MRWRRALALAALLASITGPAAAAAEPAVALDIRIERDLAETVGFSELGASFNVTITDPATGRAPDQGLEVFGLLRDGNGDESEVFECEHLRDNDPAKPVGLYYCPVYADRGGRYEFVAVVNERRVSDNQVPRTLARASAPFELVTDQVYTGDPDKAVVRGRVFEVFMLWGHAAAAAGWFGAALALAALALPRFRRHLSDLATYRLERRLDLIVRATVALTGLVIGTGIYLLLNQTAYKTPFSKSAFDGVSALPFGKPYFVALAVKLAVYALMVPAVVPLMRGAQRNLRVRAAAESETVAPNPWQGSGVGGGVATAVKTQTARTCTTDSSSERSATVAGKVAGLVVVVGLPAILFCVTLLKYFHELVEASRVLR